MGQLGDFFNRQNYGMIVKSSALTFFLISVYVPSLSSWLYAVFSMKNVLSGYICILST